MQLPRFLWVPFELGRPFGAPNEPRFQRRVLRTALELLERSDGPVVLDDFPEDAPNPPEPAEGEAAWACPVTFHPPEEERPELVAATLLEMARLEPWHEIHADTRGGTAPPASEFSRDDIVRLLGELARRNEAPAVESALPIQEWIRLGCDDLRNWYLDAAQGQPGRGSAEQLREWFWRDTAAARLIASAAEKLKGHPEPMVVALALRAMVPREYLAHLAPEIDPFAWRKGEEST